MNAYKRRLKLKQLKELTKGDRGLLSNAKCLSEGVDVPVIVTFAMDEDFDVQHVEGVMFSDDGEMLLFNAEPLEFDFFKSTTTLGKFYMFSGILPNFLFLIIIYRFIKYIVLTIFVEKKVKKAIKKINFKKREKNVFWLAPIIVLGIGILPLPIGYYMLSRLIVSGCALYFAHKFYKKNTSTKLWIFGFFVILYNPIAPIYLYEKGIWILINIPTIYYFYINRRYV